MVGSVSCFGANLASLAGDGISESRKAITYLGMQQASSLLHDTRMDTMHN